MSKREEIKEKIILATVECIEKYGLKNTTTRNIIDIAGVNISAISYYFQGIDNLINIVLDNTLDNAFCLDDIEINEEDSYKTVMRKVAHNWLYGAYAYPNISRSHIEILLSDTAQSEKMHSKADSFLMKLYRLLVDHGMPDDSAAIARLHALFSSLFGHILLSGFKENTEKDEAFIQYLTASI